MKRGFEVSDFENFSNEELVKIMEERKKRLVRILEDGGSMIEGSGSNLYDSLIIIWDILEERGIEVEESF